MNPFSLAVALTAIMAASIFSADAFTTPSSSQRQVNAMKTTPTSFTTTSSQQLQRLAASTSSSAETEKDSAEASAASDDEITVDDELMYAMGINLGRQLGDIRPLVNDSEELTQLAKGLLDYFVGKLDDEDATELLRKRGKELDKLVVERA